MFCRMSDDSARRTPRPMNVQVDPQVAPGVYANMMMITHRPEEFVLDFLFAPPQTPNIKEQVALLRSRVIVAPAHVKRILRALEENVRRYEASFGTIPDGSENQPTLQ
jgi:hypothetical protein